MKKLALIFLALSIVVVGGATAVAIFQLELLDQGNGDEQTQENRAPTAAIDYEPAHPKVDEPVSFSATNSTDPDDDALTYAWELGDGTTASSREVEHTYEAEGTYEINLTVSDPEGLEDTTSITITVTGGVLYEDSRNGSVGGFGNPNSADEGFPVAEAASKVQLWWNLTDNSLTGGAQVRVIITDSNNTELYNDTQGEGEYLAEFEGSDLEHKGDWNWHIESDSGGTMDYQLDIKVRG